MRTEEEAREAYEAACSELLYVTRAAWTRWEDLPIDGRLSWLTVR